MHVQEFSLNQASLLSDGFFSVDPSENGPPRILPTYPTHRSESSSVLTTLQRILNRLGRMELPGADQFEAFLRHVARRNRRPRTLCSLWQSNMLFLCMLKDGGRSELGGITRADVEAFIEREQDRGIKITTIRTRLVCVCAFLRYLAEEKVISAELFLRRIRLQLPERLPRAMDPDDLVTFLSVIDDTQDRAMILVLLRTGMRIGELLQTRVMDVHVRERRIEIYEGEKNRLGRVVYLSDDALSALETWMRERNALKEYLFYGRAQDGRMCYSTARGRFMSYIERAELDHRGYTVHTLRHTFATELLNAGMRLECLQVLLGHRCIEETRRYARLTDKTREEEYFRAMSAIERGNDDEGCDHPLAALSEEAQLLAQHG